MERENQRETNKVIPQKHSRSIFDDNFENHNKDKNLKKPGSYLSSLLFLGTNLVPRCFVTLILLLYKV